MTHRVCFPAAAQPTVGGARGLERRPVAPRPHPWLKADS